MKKKLLTLLALLTTIVSGAWADTETICSANLSAVTDDNRSSGSANGTDCTIGWYNLNKPSEGQSVGTIKYIKINSGYVTLALNSGSFAAGDVITASVTANGNNKNVGINLHTANGNGNTTTVVTQGTAYDVSYTLVAADIEEDGSLKIFGPQSNGRYYSFNVTREIISGPSFTMTTPTAATDVAINTNVVLTADEDITAVGSTIAGTIMAGDADETDITFSLSGRTLTYAPESPLAYNTTYVVKLSANQVQNGENEKNSEKNFTFTTMAVPSTSTTVNAAASNKDVIFDNSGTISADTKTLSLADVPITIVGSQKFESGSNNYKFRIGENDYAAIKVSKNGTYVVTPGPGVTVNSVTAYATSNSDSKSAISSPGKDEAELNPRGTSGTPATPDGYALGKNESGDFQFTISGSASQAIVVLVINYDCSENVDVNISAAGYATLYFDSNLIVPTGVTAYKAAVNGENIALTDIGNLIPANTGVILKADAGKYNFMTSTDDASNVDISGNILTGTVTGTSVSANSVYTLGQNSEGIVGLRLYTGTSIRAYSAYSTSISSAPSFMEFNFIGESTGVNFVKNQMENARGDFYNLNGQRVAQPTKGLYIVNGRKVIMK